MPDFPMTPDEAQVLAWIHSNKFITTKLYAKKFRPTFSFQTACNDLNQMALEKKFLKRVTAHSNADSFYFCTRATIHRLKDLGLILTSPEIRAPHQNTYEKEHDKRIIEIRILFENSPDLKNLIWLSDYEMRIGYQLEWRKALSEGRGQELKVVKLRIETKRGPDACIEASIYSKDWSFILEYEHSPYSKERLKQVVNRLMTDYEKPIKLIITEKPARVPFLMEKIGAMIHDENDRAAWWFSDYKTVTSLPFLKVPWIDLDDYHPALITPIL